MGFWKYQDSPVFPLSNVASPEVTTFNSLGASPLEHVTKWYTDTDMVFQTKTSPMNSCY